MPAIPLVTAYSTKGPIHILISWHRNMHMHLLMAKLLPTDDDLAHTGYPLHRENRKNGKKTNSLSEKTENLEILPKHREFGLLSL